MRKNKFFIILVILTLFTIFATAATCNFCGIKLDTATSEKSEEEKNTTSEVTESNEEITEETEPEEIEAVAEEDNNNPFIETIAVNENEINESDEIRVVSGNYLNFVVIASDEDDDELTYSANDNIGNNLEITKLDNTFCGFSWLAPNNPGLYDLTIKVEDNKSGEDHVVIHILVNADVAENHPPEIQGDIIIENLPGDSTPAGGPYKAGQIHYKVYVNAVDPDGDPLTYGWMGGGPYGFTNQYTNPTEWITPDSAITYCIRVLVRDGRGGEANTYRDVPITDGLNQPDEPGV